MYFHHIHPFSQLLLVLPPFYIYPFWHSFVVIACLPIASRSSDMVIVVFTTHLHSPLLHFVCLASTQCLGMLSQPLWVPTCNCLLVFKRHCFLEIICYLCLLYLFYFLCCNDPWASRREVVIKGVFFRPEHSYYLIILYILASWSLC